jgi:hypothetical protein
MFVMRGNARWLLPLVLLLATAALTPLAYATPPDPTWVSGFFDDDDNDDAVFLITSSTATLDPFPLYGSAPFPVHSPAFLCEDRSPAAPQYFSTADARASPTA